ncbi:hypothetical protein EVAR_51730_1 [Eumeta japonica]|uniref:Uncharacterized protein n=1 Tax=Eumeta variegata TaxID=151549 RepID=A0A4C1XHA6_EUMVA|nr:hypothetical protein EVAR_51730_1 [Eumeta japonica]
MKDVAIKRFALNQIESGVRDDCRRGALLPARIVQGREEPSRDRVTSAEQGVTTLDRVNKKIYDSGRRGPRAGGECSGGFAPADQMLFLF